MRAPIAVLALLMFVPALAAAQTPADRPDFARDRLAIETADGTVHAFDVEVARSQAERGFGLMFVTEMSADQGMLFLYPRPKRVGMWMKNTKIPLDMLFIQPDGTIESIAERTVPESTRTIRARGRVSAVLELNGGTAARLGIAPGDRVIHPAFAD